MKYRFLQAGTALLLVCFTSKNAVSQNTNTDSTAYRQNLPAKYTYNSHRLFAPAFLICTGGILASVKPFRQVNTEIKNELWTEEPHKPLHFDNYLPYFPVASIYMFNFAGLKGRSSLRDVSMLYLISNIYMNTIVQSSKKITHVERPDLSNYRSFPSGHTAQAFLCAEMLRIEYGKRSPWFGIAGYAAASGTAYLRMYNNKHWFSDVVAGAGVGILSTRLAYWTYNRLKPKIFKEKKSQQVYFLPSYQNPGFGFAIIVKLPGK